MRRRAMSHFHRSAMSIIGMHAIMYSRQAEAVREFLRETLGWSSVDAGRGWLIFAAPPTEMAVHPTDGARRWSGADRGATVGAGDNDSIAGWGAARTV
jgi:hypothetical protein